jgi:hypothetical protein
MRNLRSLIGIFISIGLLTALAVSPASAQPRFDPPGLERAIEAQEGHTDALLTIQGVVGTAVGAGANGQAVVKIYTEKSGIGGLPRSLDGVPVVVQVTGKIQALHHREGHGGGPGGPGGGGGEEVDPAATFSRPVYIGVSSGTERLININGQLFCTVGTLGARVNKASGTYALSNAHVYALEGSTPVGDVNGARILQPGRVEMTDQACGSAAEIDAAEIGTLSEFVPVDFSGGNNTVDAAIALTDINEVGTDTPPNGYGTPLSTIVSPAFNMDVQKYGRTTSLTKGTIKGTNATIRVGYDNGVATFIDQIEVQGGKGSFIKGGDSGSLLVTDPERNPVGLLFAGNRSGKTAFANPIDAVLDSFGVTIDGE